jgi:2-keto-3-deoxy-6-phosphogluconate aldolase
MDALGAASVHGPEGLQAAREAGLRDASSPVFDPELWRARALGCRLVKLFPAAPLGPHYWRGLDGPPGPLPAVLHRCRGDLLQPMWGRGELPVWMRCGPRFPAG